MVVGLNPIAVTDSIYRITDTQKVIIVMPEVIVNLRKHMKVLSMVISS